MKETTQTYITNGFVEIEPFFHVNNGKRWRGMEREREREICGHTLPQLVYLSDEIMECHLIYI